MQEGGSKEKGGRERMHGGRSERGRQGRRRPVMLKPMVRMEGLIKMPGV